ncbi:MAG: hypothetical protein GXO74_00610 [Calditrichaeota bacterium]|nr:hypothetical protein [Calditrichota bacterium]
MDSKKLILVLALGLLLIFGTQIYAQQKIVAFVKPLQAIGVPESFANRATQQFRNALSQTGRFGLISEETWRNVMETQGIVMENIALFDEDQDKQIAKLVNADVITYGKLEQEGNVINFSLDYYNVAKKYNDFSFLRQLISEGDLNEAIKNIVSQIMSNIVPKGEVLSINGNVVRIKISSKQDEWKPGKIFNLKKPDGTIYGKVSIINSDGDVAIGNTKSSELTGFVVKGDIVEMATIVPIPINQKPNVGLASFESTLNQSKQDDIYLNCQTQINKSHRVNLFDDRTIRDVYLERSPVKLDYIIDGEIKKDIEYGTYSVTIRLKAFSTEQIIKQDYLKCTEKMLDKTIEILLHSILSYFPLQGEVKKIDEKEIQVNLGEDQNVRKKMKFVVKAKDSKNMICEGKVKNVYREYFTCKRDQKMSQASLGDIVQMREDEKLAKKTRKLREKISDEYYRHVEAINKAAADSLANVEKKKTAAHDKIQEKLAPKSRLKFSLAKIQWEQDYQENLYGGKKTTKFNAAMYLGNHPNFHIAFNYQYAYFEDNTRAVGSEGNSFISSQSYGVGARIQFVLPFLFSTSFMPYVEGFGQFANFSPNLKSGSRIHVAEDRWTAYYALADVGVEFVFNRKFSLFGQIGATRKLKSPAEKPKFEYLFIDGGIGIWF